MFKKFKRATAVSRLLDEQLYAQAVAELGAGERRDGLWGKALAHSDGNYEKAHGLYIKYRVQSLKDESTVIETLEEIASTNVHEQQIAHDKKTPTNHRINILGQYFRSVEDIQQEIELTEKKIHEKKLLSNNMKWISSEAIKRGVSFDELCIKLDYELSTLRNYLKAYHHYLKSRET